MKKDNQAAIVFVCSKVPPDHSGAGKRIYNFYEYLRKNRFEVKLITHTILDDDISLTIKQTSEGLPCRINLLLDFIKSFIKIAVVFIFHRPLKNHVKAVWLLSCCPITFAAAIVFHFLGYKIITQNTLVGSDDPIYKYPGDFLGIKYKLKKMQYTLSDCITSISPALFSLSGKYYSNCVMIPNPVDPKYQSLQSYRNRVQNTKNVLFVGELSQRKGIDIVLNAINIVHKATPSIFFTIVGPMDKQNNRLDTLFNKLPYINKNKVVFAGFQIDPSPYYANADIFFMPSRQEGFGSVFIEAMASGLPVVAKKLDGITDYIFGDDYKTILDTENPESYANIILSLVKNNNLYESLSKKGLELVKRFEKENIYQEYLSLIIK